MNWGLFFSTFAVIAVAELPDKTSLATVMMSSRGRPLPIFLGVAAAFVVQTTVAVIFGTIISAIPSKWVRLAAGLAFLAFAVMIWREKEQEKADELLRSPHGLEAMSREFPFLRECWGAFLVIFIAEWGDLTQLATASLVARTHDPVTIFMAAVCALWGVTAIAVTVGRSLRKIISPVILQRVAAVVFTLVGFYFLATWVTSA